MGKVAVGCIEAPLTVFVSLGYRAAHFVVKVDNELAVANDFIDIAVCGKCRVGSVHILIVKGKIGVVIIGKDSVAGEDIVSVAEGECVDRLFIPPGLIDIDDIVERPIISRSDAENETVNRFGDDIVFVGTAFDKNLDFFVGVLNGVYFEGDAVIFFDKVVSFLNGTVDGVAFKLFDIRFFPFKAVTLAPKLISSIFEEKLPSPTNVTEFGIVTFV